MINYSKDQSNDFDKTGEDRPIADLDGQTSLNTPLQ